jgi:hypothetical protein
VEPHKIQFSFFINVEFLIVSVPHSYLIPAPFLSGTSAFINVILSTSRLDLYDTNIAFPLDIDATFFSITSHFHIMAIFLLETVA